MAVNYAELARAYKALNRWMKPRRCTSRRRSASWSTRPVPHQLWLAFLKAMRRRWPDSLSRRGRPGAEEPLLAIQADAEGWYGKLKNAHELTGGRWIQRCVTTRRGGRGISGRGGAARVESGYREQARAEAEAAAKLAKDRDYG